MDEQGRQFKHHVEQLFSMGMTEATMIAPSSLNQGTALNDLVARAHTYVIARRPRTSIVTFDDHSDQGVLTVNLENTKGDRHSLFIQVEQGYSIDVDESGFSITISAEGEAIFDGRASLLLTQPGAPSSQLPIDERVLDTDLDENFLDLEVLYIGKSEDDEGVAHQRLRAHSTLQRILADHMDWAPQYELWVIPMRFGMVNTVSIVHGRDAASSVGMSADVAGSGINPALSEQSRLALAEAAAIRYFQPRYNVHYKNSFPKRSHDSYSEVLPYDFNGLGITINTFSWLGCRLWSDAAEPSFLHDKYFPIDPVSKRRSLTEIREILDLFSEEAALSTN